MTTKPSFQRCNDEFEVIDEELRMSVTDSIKPICSWFSPPTQMYIFKKNPNIDRELEFIKRYVRKEKRMLTNGTKVIIQASGDYGGRFKGKTGIIEGYSYAVGKYAIAINGFQNPETITGWYWFPSEAVILYDNGSNSIVGKTSIKRVIFSGNRTIILWSDGTKTIATCGDGDQFDRYAGFCAAITKRIFGSTSKAKQTLEKAANTHQK